MEADSTVVLMTVDSFSVIGDSVVDVGEMVIC